MPLNHPQRGAGVEEYHHRAAIEAADVTERVLLIETSNQHAMAWGRFLVHPGTLMIMTSEDVPHPGTRAAGESY